MEKIRIGQTVLVEGKYDKIKLESVIDANIITTGGFSVFNNEEKIALIRRIADTTGLIILTDSDPAGFVLRNKLKGMLPKSDKILHIYIPSVKGKEKRKKEYSKAGLIGVEGMSAEKIRELFSEYVVEDKQRSKEQITKAYLYEKGLSGASNSTEKRAAIAQKLGLPSGMTANAFLEAINILGVSKEELNIDL